jgi:hypothetical protein
VFLFNSDVVNYLEAFRSKVAKQHYLKSQIHEKKNDNQRARHVGAQARNFEELNEEYTRIIEVFKPYLNVEQQLNN